MTVTYFQAIEGVAAGGRRGRAAVLRGMEGGSSAVAAAPTGAGLSLARKPTVEGTSRRAGAMSESAGLTRGDLSSLGALLALLHRADAAFDSVAATYRFWRHEERASAAWRAQIEEEKLRGAAITSFALHDDSDRPAETEEVLRSWRAAGCVREEREGGPRDGAYAVRDGDAWWAW